MNNKIELVINKSLGEIEKNINFKYDIICLGIYDITNLKLFNTPKEDISFIFANLHRTLNDVITRIIQE